MSSGPGYRKHPEHRVATADARSRVRVIHRGEVLADSTRAVVLSEASYPPVYYVPRADVRMERLTPSAAHTHCPFKGDASYFSLGDVSEIAWSYEQPYDEVAVIAGHLAFYPNKVDAIEVDAPSIDATEVDAPSIDATEVASDPSGGS